MSSSASKLERGRPIYREIEGLRIAVGLTPCCVATLSEPAIYARCNPNPFLPVCADHSDALRASPSAGLYSLRIAPLRTRSGFVHAGHDPQWRGGPFESRMLWAIVRNGQYVKCSRD